MVKATFRCDPAINIADETKDAIEAELLEVSQDSWPEVKAARCFVAGASFLSPSRKACRGGPACDLLRTDCWERARTRESSWSRRWRSRTHFGRPSTEVFAYSPRFRRQMLARATLSGRRSFFCRRTRCFERRVASSGLRARDRFTSETSRVRAAGSGRCTA